MAHTQCGFSTSHIHKLLRRMWEGVDIQKYYIWSSQVSNPEFSPIKSGILSL
jgi:hypothetical protein